MAGPTDECRRLFSAAMKKLDEISYLMTGTRDFVSMASRIELTEELTALLGKVRSNLDETQVHLSRALHNPVPELIIRVRPDALFTLVEEFKIKVTAHVNILKKIDEMNRLESMYLGSNRIDVRLDLQNAFGSNMSFNTRDYHGNY